MKVTNTVWTLVVLSLLGFNCSKQAQTQDNKSLEQQLAVYKEKEEAGKRLGQYTLNVMQRTAFSKELSEARKIMLAQDVVRVAMDIFPDNEEHRKSFVVVIAIESGFNKLAQSPTGPKGMSQLAKGAFKDGSTYCSIPKTNESDVWSESLNLTIGACYFRKLLEDNGNDPLIAIVAYNQGPHSDSAKSYSKNGQLEEKEPLKYVAKFSFLSKVVGNEKSPDAPLYKDLTSTAPQKALQKVK